MSTDRPPASGKPRNFGQQWDKAGPDDPANRIAASRTPASGEPSSEADFDDPAYYEPVGMKPQCTYIVHWHSCRLNAGHSGKHSPGREARATPPALTEDLESRRPKGESPEWQAYTFRAYGEAIQEIGMRAFDHDLSSDEIAAVAFLARNTLAWCGRATPPALDWWREIGEWVHDHAIYTKDRPDTVEVEALQAFLDELLARPSALGEPTND